MSAPIRSALIFFGVSLLTPAAALAQSISSGPVTTVPVSGPLGLVALGALLLLAVFWQLRHRQVRPALVVALAIGGGVLWCSATFLAQSAASFYKPAGETLPIPVTQIRSGGNLAGFQYADFTNESGGPLVITGVVDPTYAQCFPGGLFGVLLPPAPPPPSPPPTCSPGLTLAFSLACRVNVDALCRATTTGQLATLVSIAPASGGIAGGTPVTLTGTNLTGATSVTFGGVAATGVMVVNATTVTAVTPAHALGAVNVVINTPQGTATLTGGYTYVSGTTLALVTPNSGTTAGGTSVTVTGTGLTGATSLTFGGVPATALNVSPTTVTAATPAHAAGPVDVVISTPQGTATLTGGYTYVPGPTLTAVAPPSGGLAGGTAVTLTGTGFTGATSVTFDGLPATAVNVVNATTVTAVTPAHALGAVDVGISTPFGNATLPSGYTYVSGTTLALATPNAGVLTGGTAVTLTGTGLTGATSVTFDGIAATSVIAVNATTVTAVTPAHAAAVVDVVISTPQGNATLTGGFTYVAGPTLGLVAPASGVLAGGTAVTLTGTNLTGATSVTFDGLAATSVVVVNAATVTAVTPAHALGVVTVGISTPFGNATLPNGYTYVSGSTLTGVNPTTGVVGGGTAVTLTGTNLTGATSVTFDGVAATSVIVVNATTVTAVTPAHAAGAVNVVIATPAGGATLTSGYTYVAGPTLTGVNPTSGALAGGTAVTLTGTGLTGTTSVTFDGVPANSVIVVNTTTVTAVTPAHAAGTVDIGLTTPFGSATLTGGYTYSSTLSNVTANVGTASGGTSVTLTGTNLTGATDVTFDGVAATFLNVVNSTTVTAVTPAHAAGAVNVVIATPAGGATLINGYTYVATAVGQPSGGGIIAVLDGGLNNLIAATADQSAANQWGPAGTTGAVSNNNGAGNTAILAALPGDYAAHVCSNYEVDSQANTPCQAGNACYSDWFLPAPGQLAGLYNNRVAVGGFANFSYWSSMETDVSFALGWAFTTGASNNFAKGTAIRVRCVRAFTP